MARYLINILIGLDQLATTIVGGYPDESLSSYAFRLERQGKVGGRIFRPMIDWLFFWQENHCFLAYEEERLRWQFPAELRF